MCEGDVSDIDKGKHHSVWDPSLTACSRDDVPVQSDRGTEVGKILGCAEWSADERRTARGGQSSTSHRSTMREHREEEASTHQRSLFSRQVRLGRRKNPTTYQMMEQVKLALDAISMAVRSARVLETQYQAPILLVALACSSVRWFQSSSV